MGGGSAARPHAKLKRKPMQFLKQGGMKLKQCRKQCLHCENYVALNPTSYHPCLVLARWLPYPFSLLAGLMTPSMGDPFSYMEGTKANPFINQLISKENNALGRGFGLGRVYLKKAQD